MRGLASGNNVTTFTVASNEFIGNGKQKTEYHVKGKVLDITGRNWRSYAVTAPRERVR